MHDYSELIEKLKGLSLDGFTQILQNIIDKIQNNEIEFYEAINELVDNQIKVKKEKVYRAGIKVSHFPFIKTFFL